MTIHTYTHIKVMTIQKHVGCTSSTIYTILPIISLEEFLSLQPMFPSIIIVSTISSPDWVDAQKVYREMRSDFSSNETRVFMLVAISLSKFQSAFCLLFEYPEGIICGVE